jgi:hypothetical protein
VRQQSKIEEEHTMTSIYEVGPGDYVKVGYPGVMKKIVKVTATKDLRDSKHFKSWTLVTEDGSRVTMNDARSYHKKEEIEGSPAEPPR